jgi:hypothetical protein
VFEPFCFIFTFTLPPELRLEAPAGRHQPCTAGCVLTIDSRGQVTIEGCSREQVFAQARRFLRVIGRGYGPLEMAARLRTPERIIYEPGGCDSWSITIGADVVISAAIAPQLQDAPERAGGVGRKAGACPASAD